MALRLARLLGGSAESWLNMQRAVDLWELQRERMEVYDRIEPVASSGEPLRHDTQAMTTEPQEFGCGFPQVRSEAEPVGRLDSALPTLGPGGVVAAPHDGSMSACGPSGKGGYRVVPSHKRRSSRF